MAVKESAYIRNELVQTGPVSAPLFCDDGYTNGDYIERGFPVDDKPETPEHITVRVGPTYIVDDSDMTPPYALPENQPTEHTKVIHAGPQVTYVFDGEATEADRKERQADAVAAAVKSAILRGEIDASEFAIE